MFLFLLSGPLVAVLLVLFYEWPQLTQTQSDVFFKAILTELLILYILPLIELGLWTLFRIPWLSFILNWFLEASSFLHYYNAYWEFSRVSSGNIYFEMQKSFLVVYAVWLYALFIIFLFCKIRRVNPDQLMEMRGDDHFHRQFYFQRFEVIASYRTFAYIFSYCVKAKFVQMQ